MASLRTDSTAVDNFGLDLKRNKENEKKKSKRNNTIIGKLDLQWIAATAALGCCCVLNSSHTVPDAGLTNMHQRKAHPIRNAD